MRFSLSAAAAAMLPAVAVAQDFQQYQAQFQNFLGNMGSYIPNPGQHDPVAALEAKTGALKLHTLTLDNWKNTLYEPVLADAEAPEWWVMTTGRNRTCFGRCGGIEQAFNETAAKFAVTPGAPYMAILNCEDQPVLCNTWSAGAAGLWVFDMAPNPADVDVWKKRLNTTTTTADDLLALPRGKENRAESFTLVDGFFHPIHGPAVEYGLALPFGYLVWFFNVVPNWLLMLSISFFSRSMMNRQMQGVGGQ